VNPIPFVSRVFPVAYKNQLFLTYGTPVSTRSNLRKYVDEPGSFVYSTKTDSYYYVPIHGKKKVGMTADQVAEAVCQLLLQRDKVSYGPAPHGPLPLQSVRGDGAMLWPISVRDWPWAWAVGWEGGGRDLARLANHTAIRMAQAGVNPEDLLNAFSGTCGTGNAGNVVRSLKPGLIVSYDLPSLINDAKRAGIPGISLYKIWTLVYESSFEHPGTHARGTLPPYVRTSSGNAFVQPCAPGRAFEMLKDYAVRETIRFQSGQPYLVRGQA
jgi:hypothetical protein